MKKRPKLRDPIFKRDERVAWLWGHHADSTKAGTVRAVNTRGTCYVYEILADDGEVIEAAEHELVSSPPKTVRLKRDGSIIVKPGGYREVILVPEDAKEDRPSIFVSALVESKDDEMWLESVVARLLSTNLKSTEAE